MTELEKVEQAAEYFRRYHQMENAITQNRENQEYLKTYIHDDDYVADNFDLIHKVSRGVALSCAVGIFLFLLLWLFTKSWIVGLVLGLFVMIGGSVFFFSLHHYRLDAAKAHQREVNEGITEQIEVLKAKEPQLIQTKENFYKGLEERIDFMSLEDMKYIDEIAKILKSGEAETAEEAAQLLETKLLMQTFNSIMEQSETKIYTDEENRERFGDPLELINKKKRKPLFGFLKKKG